MSETAANLARRARAALGDPSQREFARLLGVSNAAVSRWEKGLIEPCGAARSLLLVAAAHPKAVERTLRRETQKAAGE